MPPPALIPFSGTILQGSVSVYLARVADTGGVPITPGNTASIAYKVIDTTVNPANILVSSTPVAASAVSGSLHVDARWVVDSIGYNFVTSLPATIIPAYPTPPPTRVRVEFKFTLTTGDVIIVPFDVPVRPTYS